MSLIKDPKIHNIITDIVSYSFRLNIDISVKYDDEFDTHFIYITNGIISETARITDINDTDSWSECVRLMLGINKMYRSFRRDITSISSVVIKEITATFINQLTNKSKEFSIKF